MTPQEEIAPLGDVPVEIEVELDRRIMTTRELLRLDEGSVIETTVRRREHRHLHRRRAVRLR
jgi:flagellar motor switch/type III secretory pathway protein FliN